MDVLYFCSQLTQCIDQYLYRTLLHTCRSCNNPFSRSHTQIGGKEAHSSSGSHDVNRLLPFGESFYHYLCIVTIRQIFR